jgi:hypothetical protein
VPDEPITAADVRAAAQDVYDRLKYEMAAQARAAVLSDLSALLSEMELHDNTGDPYDMGYMGAWKNVRDWMNAQAPTEGAA